MHCLPVRAAFIAASLGCLLQPVLYVRAAHAAEPITQLPAISIRAAGSLTLDTAVSTGSGLDLTPLETPASVTVITREQLEQRGDSRLSDAVSRSPGLSHIGHPGNGGEALSARGFTGSNSVMQLYDGMRQYGGVGITFPFDTWSVERVEVLRGPAAVIYGEGAIGGVVNIVPKKPQRGPVDNEIQARLGTDNTQGLAWGSGGAIDDRFSYRFDISGNRSDGWVDMGDSRNLTFSGALTMDVSPDFNLTLSHAQGWQKPMRYFGVPLVDGEQDDSLRDKNFNVDDAVIAFRDRWTELSALWTPNNAVTVRSRLYQIDSERHWRNAEYYDYLPASGLIKRSSYTDIRHQQSQTGNTTDVRIDTHLFGLKNQVSLGFDVNRSHFKHSNNSPYGGVSYLDPNGADRGEFIDVVPATPRYRNKASQYSLFAEDRVELTDAWSVLAGLRYDHINLSRRDLAGAGTSFDQSFSNVGWRVGSVYDILPGLAVYVQYSEAADSVGSLLMMSPSTKDFDLSVGKQWEVGIKQRFWDDQGEWTLAAYRIVKNGLLTRDIADPSKSVQIGQQSSRGLEATVGLDLGAWRLDANAAILRARYDDFVDASNGTAVSRSGNVPTDVPQRLANVWLSWRFQPHWTASAGLRYVGKRYADRANTLELPAYTTADLAVQWAPRPDLTLALRSFNIFDRHYAETAYYNQTQWLQGPGRRFELTANYRF
ncbi:TonB-dependent receptor [Allopusillimonas ginsengisoli]|uniref:TonB-dependent receptor n=1 Tax=Allopusillimonas ginsengisoli TaxID=453575 RepID=UPI00101F1D5F|nr:TonB-dependent receptor [Allopusillimonas ginsengisoli]TEA77788.1 TonB-dependent receptor [Allopusillimonas ginsengisoli]